MKKILLITILLLLPFVAFSQKKKKTQGKKIVKKEFVSPKLENIYKSTPDNEGYNMIAVPADYDNLRVSIKKNNNKISYFNNLKHLDTIDIQQIKEITLHSLLNEKTKKLDVTILKKLLTEASALEILEVLNFELDSFPKINTTNNHLKKLSLTKNKLASLPESISNLEALEEFYSDNPLPEIPESFSKLKNLKSVSLNSVQFSEFPKVVFNLNNLEKIYISGESVLNIKELPDLFHNLPKIKEFGFTNAMLTSLPKSFATLSNLKDVSLSNNQFKDLPEALAINKKLNYIRFTNNPLQWKPFFESLKKVKWRGLFFLNDTKLTKQQYQTVQKMLPTTDVYFDE